jgi:hypothetical protein
VWAEKYLQRKSVVWCAKHAEKCRSRVRKDLLPLLGKETMTALQDNQPLVLRSIQRIEAHEAGDTARRALNDVSTIFRRAIASGTAKRDPTVGMTDALTPIVEGHFSAVTELQLAHKKKVSLVSTTARRYCRGAPR